LSRPGPLEKSSHHLLLQLQQESHCQSLCPQLQLGASIRLPPPPRSLHPRAARKNWGPCGSLLPASPRPGGGPTLPACHGIPWHGVGWQVAQSSLALRVIPSRLPMTSAPHFGWQKGAGRHCLSPTQPQSLPSHGPSLVKRCNWEPSLRPFWCEAICVPEEEGQSRHWGWGQWGREGGKTPLFVQVI